METLNNFASIYCLIAFAIGSVFMLIMLSIVAMLKPKEPINKVRFYVTQDYGIHCLKLWMGKPELSEKLLWVSCSEHVHFLCDDFCCGNRNLFENYNLNPNDFSDMKEGEIREVFIILDD